MNWFFSRRLAAAFLTLPPLLCFVLALAGCQPDHSPQAYNVNIHLVDSLRDPSGGYPGVDVFLKGVSPWERQQDWEGHPDLERYSRYRGPLAPGDVEHALRLGAGDPPTQQLLASDPAWSRWLSAGATDLVVISNYPRQRPNSTGRDRRLLILPLARDRYPDNNLSIEVTGTGLELLTPPRVKSP